MLSCSDLLYCSCLYSSYLAFGLSPLRLHTLVFKRLFKGKSATELAKYVTPFIHTLDWYPPALDRLLSLRRDGVRIYIFSNSPRFLVKPLGALIGVDHVIATDYHIDEKGHLRDIAALITGKKKAQELKKLQGRPIAFSDSHHDLPFLEAASQAVAVNPTRRLFNIATRQGWEIL